MLVGRMGCDITSAAFGFVLLLFPSNGCEFDAGMRGFNSAVELPVSVWIEKTSIRNFTH